MPCWYYDKKELRNTPSLQDDIDYETECRYRKEGARFIIDAGTKMDLGYNTAATGVVYFHRFYMFHSFREFPRYVMASCCLFLAGKVEETPKKCSDIIKIAKTLLGSAKFAQFSSNPKEEILTLERILLQTIKFDLQVEHPYQFLLKYAKSFKYPDAHKAKLQKMVQMAWTFVNDSLCTTLCLQWEPEVIAVALMYLAGKLSKFEVVDWIGKTHKHLFWWDMFVEDITMNLLEDICHQVLDLYSAPQQAPTPDSPPVTKLPPIKKSKTLPVPTVMSPSVMPLTPPPPPVPDKITKGAIGDVKMPQENPHLFLSENNIGHHYSYQPSYNNAPNSSMYPPYPQGPVPGPVPGMSVPPPSNAFPPNYPVSYPPASTLTPPPNFYPRQPSNYFPPS